MEIANVIFGFLIKILQKNKWIFKMSYFEDHLLAEWPIGIKEEELDSFVKL